MTAAAASIDLTNTDLLYAVSQYHLNRTLAAFLANGSRMLQFAFDFDADGNLVTPKNAANPDVSFQGTLMPVTDPNTGSLLVPIVDMSGGKEGTGQVVLQLTFAAGAVFEDRDRHGNRVTFTQADPSANGGKDAWTVRLTVNLSKAALSSLPPAVQQNLDLLKGQYDAAFSVQQVFADLSSATLSSSVDESNVPAAIGVSYWDDLCQGLINYLKADQANGQIPFGFVTTASSTGSSNQLPALVPTNADVIVLPNQNPDLSALVFTLMTEQRPLPDQETLYGTFAGVSLFDDPSVAGAYALVRRGLFVELAQAAVNSAGIPAATSQYVAATVTHDDYMTVAFNLTAGTPAPLQPFDPAQTSGSLLSLSFSQTSSDSYGEAFAGIVSAKATTTSNFSATVTQGTQESRSQLAFTGAFVVNADQETSPAGGRGSSFTMPSTTFPWSVTFELDVNNQQAVSSAGGTIVFNVIANDFTQTPTVAQSEGGFLRFLSELGGGFQSSDLGNIRESVANFAQGTLASKFESSLAGFNRFVMPGSDVFLFSGVALNSAYTLVAEISFAAAN